ncbi:O-antigen ligase family protein [Octadecabacter sp.]|nr:O-antigen ligase family protein [Octadecabacter sp.]
MTLARSKTWSNPLILLCILNLPIMYLDGYIYTKIGFDRFQSMYFALVMSLSFIYILYSKNFIAIRLLIPLFTLSIAFIVSPLNISSFGGLSGNLKYLIRGPFLFILLVICFKDKISDRTIRAFCLITIITCTISTFFHAFMSFGFSTKSNKLNPILNGYFSDTNSATFLLLLASLVYLHSSLSKTKSFILTLALTFNLAALDSKAGILLVFVYLLVTCYFFIFSNTKPTRLILCTIIIIIMAAVLTFPTQIAHFLLNLVYTISVKDAGSLNFRFETWNLLSIVTATRDLKFIALNDTYPLFENFSTLLFGNSFGIYQDHSLVESDFLDSLMALGLIGCISTFMLYVPILCSRSKFNKPNVAVPLFILVVSMSLLVGHVFFSPSSVIGLAIVASYYSRTHNLLSKDGGFQNEVA